MLADRVARGVSVGGGGFTTLVAIVVTLLAPLL
jgi:hypothetical protein